MATIASIGNELAEVPIGELIRSVAEGIADGQRALDAASIRALIQLANTPIDIIPEVTEVLLPQTRTVTPSGLGPITVTGVRIDSSPSPPIRMNALQAGILPSFYQFTEALISVKLSVSVRQVTETDEDGTRRTGFRMFGSNVNFKTSNSYSYQADASSSVTVTMRPVPPPSRIVPTTVTVNALGPQPVVTHG
jgi:hypothetical protein